jgi:hypothetical protein
LLDGIEEGTLGLVGRRVAELLARCASIPEVAAHELTALLAEEVEHRAPRGVGGAGGPAVTEATVDGALVDRAVRVDFRVRSGEAPRRRVTGIAPLVPIDGEILVVEDLVAEFGQLLAERQTTFLRQRGRREGKSQERGCEYDAELG